MKISMLGVSRGGCYSPNHVDNDAAIFNKVCVELHGLGCDVLVSTEDAFVASCLSSGVVFGMPRSKEAISRFNMLEKRGALVVNSAFGIENCKRERLTRLFVDNGIPCPKSEILFMHEGHFVLPGMAFPYWAKRGDSHAMVKEDVCFVACKEEAESVFAGFEKRDVDCVVINAHLSGDLVKFYGVAGTDFFYWFYPSSCSHSKFGLEAVNGKAEGIPFDAAGLKKTCDRAASVLGVVVYGGDCIVGKDGSFKLIDFNDWPSFAPCRDAAARCIAGYIYEQALKKWQDE